MDSTLERLLEEGIISEVHGRLQSGKEAEVFIVQYGEQVVAAKVYKDRAQRSFKNNSSYKEGREVRNSRDQRAMARGSSFGKTAAEDAWKSAEADALYKLHAAEVRVPTPVLFIDGVLLMELVLDAEGNTASRLIDAGLTAELAHAAYHDMLTQLVRMLTCDLIHGDLSPYNVLWGARGLTIIDFPQIVVAAQNNSAERFFLRDAENILGFFRQLDPRLNARRGDAFEIWNAYRRGELSADFVPTGKARPPSPPAQRPIPIGLPRPPNAPASGPRHGAPPHGQQGAHQGQANFARGGQASGHPRQGAPNGQPARSGGHNNGQRPRLGGYDGQPPRNGAAPNGQQTRNGNGQQPRNNGGHQGQQPRNNGGHQGQQPRNNGGHQGQQARNHGAPGGQQARNGGPNGQPSRNGGSNGPSPGARNQSRNGQQQRRVRPMPEVIIRPRAAGSAVAPTPEVELVPPRPNADKPRPRGS